VNLSVTVTRNQTGVTVHTAIEEPPSFANIRVTAGCKRVAAWPVYFRSHPGHQFFVHRDDSGEWRVSEVRSGMYFAVGGSRSQASEQAREYLRRKTIAELEASIARSISEHGEANA
jgi:hypothetical protein